MKKKQNNTTSVNGPRNLPYTVTQHKYVYPMEKTSYQAGLVDHHRSQQFQIFRQVYSDWTATLFSVHQCLYQQRGRCNRLVSIVQLRM